MFSRRKFRVTKTSKVPTRVALLPNSYSVLKVAENAQSCRKVAEHLVDGATQTPLGTFLMMSVVIEQSFIQLLSQPKVKFDMYTLF